MTPKKFLAAVSLSMLLALMIAPSALASPFPVRASANLNVSVSYSPNTLQVNTHTTGSYSIVGGTPPFTIWMNNTPSGCNPPGNPFTASNASGTFDCVPTATGSFYITVSVHDSAGNSGSTSTSLTVNGNSGGTGGSGSGTGNNTGGIDLSFLQNLLPVVMVTGVLFLGSTVAIAVSAVALAILVPRRLKQLRKAIEGQTLTKAETKETEPEAPKAPPPPGDAR